MDIKELLWPTMCVGCGRAGAVLCKDCTKSLSRIDAQQSCLSCGAPFGDLVCTGCKEELLLDALICACTYEGAAEQVVKAYKDGPEIRLLDTIASEMAHVWLAMCETQRLDKHLGIDMACEPWSLAFVPATTEALLRRGFDHMALVAQRLSSLLGFSLIDVLVRSAVRDQRRLTRSERKLNLMGSCEVVDSVEGMNIVLIDDVVTSASTLNQATVALKARGAAYVIGLAFCRVW